MSNPAPPVNGDQDSPNVQDGEKPAAPSPQPQPALKSPGSGPKSFMDRLPPWVSSNLRSPRSRKIWLRCWIASWVAYLIMLPHASLKVLGNACVFEVQGRVELLFANNTMQCLLRISRKLHDPGEPSCAVVSIREYSSGHIVNRSSVDMQALVTMVTGMCLGWAIGAAGMRAALAARNQVLLQQSLQREAQRCAHTFGFTVRGP